MVQEPAGGSLYLVGTPIGHLGDLSERARTVLAAADVIACEDTRHSGQLLSALGAQGRRLSFHQHNTRGRIPQLLELLGQGQSVAVISDAGLPGISDPGEELAAAARSAGHPVICIPGPCAATTALVSSGLPSGRFCFEGFLPTKGRERKARLVEIAAEQRTRPCSHGERVRTPPTFFFAEILGDLRRRPKRSGSLPDVLLLRDDMVLECM